MIELVQHKIDELAALESIKSADAGACVLFSGTTRRFTKERETSTLKYQAYEAMANKEMSRLRDCAFAKWSLVECAIVHRLGEVPIGETSVVVAVSSAHRVDAFEAAQWIMDELKQSVPVWKQEVWADGTTEWVHPAKKSVESGQ